MRRGFSFVELIAAISIMAITIVPATQYLAESMILRRRLERDGILVTLAIKTIEEQMAVINGGFTTAQTTGTFAAQGFPELGYEIVRTDAVAQGGIPDLLMAVMVRVWSDDDGDVVIDTGESVVELNTKMARSIE
jgi:prepilin-type N-terminal cleavage/methylation domain-containing protein